MNINYKGACPIPCGATVTTGEETQLTVEQLPVEKVSFCPECGMEMTIRLVQPEGAV